MYKHLEQSHVILITGCGGGYDVFAGIDLAFNLMSQGKKVIFGNFTFTQEQLLKEVGVHIIDCCYKIDNTCKFDEKKHIQTVIEDVSDIPDIFFKNFSMTRREYIQSCLGSNNLDTCYFPEFKLFESLRRHNGNEMIPIYCFVRSGIKQIIDAYNRIVELENIDTVVLMDGGTDSLMTGIEKDTEGKPALGTPFEDITSIIAVHNCIAQKKFLYCLGFNIDKYHGVTDESFLENTSTLIRNDGFIGAYMLNKNDESTQKHIDIFMECDPEKSIVNSFIIASIQGHYGDYIPEWLKERLEGTIQYIHPLMGMYWIYDLKSVYDRLSYDVDALKETTDEVQVIDLLDI